MTLSLVSHVVCAVNVSRWRGFHSVLAVVSFWQERCALHSQHSVNTTVNTTVNTAKTLQITAFRGIYTFLSIKCRSSAFFDENLEMSGFSNVLAVLAVALTVVLTEC